MSEIDYFAYGSNMLLVRLLQRVPSARFHSIARLDGYVLSFCKAGSDGSGKCNLLRTENVGEQVYGVIYRIAAGEKPSLDRAEGWRYEVSDLELSAGNRTRAAFAYVAGVEHMDKALLPYDWYKAFVVAGAKAHGLPEDYVDFLDRVAAQDDPDLERAELNATILSERA